MDDGRKKRLGGVAAEKPSSNGWNIKMHLWLEKAINRKGMQMQEPELIGLAQVDPWEDGVGGEEADVTRG